MREENPRPEPHGPEPHGPKIRATGGGPPRPNARRTLFVVAFASAAALALLVLGVPGIEWARLYPTQPLKPDLARLLRARTLLPCAAFALIALLVRAAWTGGLAGKRLAWLAPCAALLLALAFASTDDAGLFSLSRDVYVQGYSNDAHLFAGPGEVWREYSARAGELTAHSRTHPPGPVLFFAMTNRLAAALVPVCEALGIGAAFTSRDVLGFALEGTVAGFLMLFLQSLWLVPLYFLAARFYGERAGVVGLALGMVVPTAALTAPTIDALFPLLTAVPLWLLAVALTGEHPRGRLVALWACGLVAGLALVFSFGLVVGAAALAASVAVLAWNERDARSGLVRLAGLTAGGLLAWGLVLATGYDPVERMRGVLGHHYGGVNRARPYALYLLASPLAFFLTLGPPVAVAFFAALRPRRAEQRGSHRSLDPLAWSALVTLAVLTASGLTRGETERLWLPLLPFVVAPAAALFARAELTTRGLLAVQGLVFLTALLWSL